MPATQEIDIPYFDVLLKKLSNADFDPEMELAFGKHVHWGYWQDPRKATGTVEDYFSAAEMLCEYVVSRTDIQNGMSILDVGCGFGGTLAYINNRFENLELTGVNIDRRQLERANSSWKQQNNNFASFVYGKACHLDFKAQSFERVFALECIFHFESRIKFFKEVFNLLKPGGIFTITDFMPLDRTSTVFRGLSRISARSTRGTYGNVDLSFSELMYRKIARDTRFHVLASYDITKNTLPTYPFVRKQMSKIRKENAVQAKIFDKATSNLEFLSKLGLMRYKCMVFFKK